MKIKMSVGKCVLCVWSTGRGGGGDDVDDRSYPCIGVSAGGPKAE